MGITEGSKWELDEYFKTQEEQTQFILRCMGIPEVLVKPQPTPKPEKKMAFKMKMRLIWVILTKW